jgi:hypothetical protein
MKEKQEVKFEVIWQSKLLDKVSDFMAGCDLGINHIECPQTEIYSWKTSEKIDLKYIAKMKKAIKLGLEHFDRRPISIRKI